MKKSVPLESVDSNSVVRRGGSISLGRPHNSICEESASRERPNSICHQVFALVTTNPPPPNFCPPSDPLAALKKI
jgi:hypothetical protein